MFDERRCTRSCRAMVKIFDIFCLVAFPVEPLLALTTIIRNHLRARSFAFACSVLPVGNH